MFYGLCWGFSSGELARARQWRGVRHREPRGGGGGAGAQLRAEVVQSSAILGASGAREGHLFCKETFFDI